LVAILWATEVIPLYSTSMLIPILIVCMKVLCDSNGNPLDAVDAANVRFFSLKSFYIIITSFISLHKQQVMGNLFSGTVLVALGAFTMSLALSKYNISYRLVSIIVFISI
jgi:phosphate transporter